MNYRHAYHAGNFADVLKHWVLCAAIEALRAKKKPFFALDTHGGSGFYDLAREATHRTGEAAGGIARLVDAAAEAPDSLRPYLDGVATLNREDTGLRWYPGSPYLIAARLRPGDRLVACDLEDGEARALGETLAPFPGARVHVGDGYAAVPSMLPPAERRGLVLIDPPFERRDEFAAMTRAATLGLRHFANGIFLLWYPVKDRTAVRAFLDDIPKPPGGAFAIDLTLAEPTLDGPLSACGLTVLNPPWRLKERLEADLPWLGKRLSAGAAAGSRIDWLREPD